MKLPKFYQLFFKLIPIISEILKKETNKLQNRFLKERKGIF